MGRTEFHGRTAYLFGGSAGIGLATARQLAALGAHVVLFARNAERLERALESVRGCRVADDQRFACLAVDVADRDAVTEVCEWAVAELGPPYLLINSAGRALPRPFEEVTHEQFDQTMRINLYGTWNTVAALLPRMKAEGQGHIVNTSSIVGFVGVFGYTDYAASKFGVLGFSEALRSEVKPHGIRVSVLCPPDTDTPGYQTENQTKPEETRAISEKAKVMQADAVAAALIRGIARNRPVIIPGLDGRLTWLAKRLAPGLVERIMDRTIARVRKTRRGDS